MPRILILFAFLIIATSCQAQPDGKLMPKALPVVTTMERKWVDSVYNRLNDDERIAQLMMVAAYSGGPNFNQDAIEKLLKANQLGGLIFMQGTATSQANLTNRYQTISKVPLLLSMDAEWGLGMRLDGITDFPRQMLIGATRDTALAYALGMAVAYQCKRLGVHVNFAPVVDVNNNPNNPVINSRSFGEDKYWVAKLAIAYMKGMQDYGVMACAKHFPGHGDTDVDSHKDLPVVNKSKAQLDTLELYPFREMIKAGVQSMMIAHLSMPQLEKEAKVPSTLSYNIVTNILKKEMGFNGLIFTDAMNMQGVVKNFPGGDGDLRAYMAGNDILLFSQDVPTAIAKIKEAVRSGKASPEDLEQRVKKVLTAKYRAGLAHFQPIDTRNLNADLNQYTAMLNQKLCEKALTLVRDNNQLMRKINGQDAKLAYVSVNGSLQDSFKKQLQKGFTQPITWQPSSTASPAFYKNYDAVIVAVHGLSRYPGGNYGLNSTELAYLKNIAAKQPNALVVIMGNAYAIRYVCEAKSLVVAYEDSPWCAGALVKFLTGRNPAKGVLPVTPVCN